MKSDNVCEVCGGKHYVISIRSDGRKAVERCDCCAWLGMGHPDSLYDEDAAILAQQVGILCDTNYPCYLPETILNTK